MKELEIVNNGIIEIFAERYDNGEWKEVRFVSARVLWKWLKSKYQFADWIRDRITRYGFEEDKDYYIMSVKSIGGVFQENLKNLGGRPKTEYMLTTDTALQLCMVEDNEEGRMARMYFIEDNRNLRRLLKTRLTSKEIRSTLTDTINRKLPETPNKRFYFKHYTDLAYQTAFGKTAKELREQYGLEDGANLRPYLNEDELRQVGEIERAIEGLLILGYAYAEVKEALSNRLLLLPKQKQ
jgi:phage anti-repressor protein